MSVVLTGQANLKAQKCYLRIYLFIALLSMTAIWCLGALALVSLWDIKLFQTLYRSPWFYGFFTIICFLFFLGCQIFYFSQFRRHGAALLLKDLPHHFINPLSPKPGEENLWNLAHDLAIASGVLMPQIAILNNEKAINALTLGFGNKDRIIALSSGAITLLNRSELRALLLHQFQNILIGATSLKMNSLSLLSVISMPFSVWIRSRLSRSMNKTVDRAVNQILEDKSAFPKLLEKLLLKSASRIQKSPRQLEHFFFSDTGSFQFGISCHLRIEERISSFSLQPPPSPPIIASATDVFQNIGRLHPADLQLASVLTDKLPPAFRYGHRGDISPQLSLFGILLHSQAEDLEEQKAFLIRELGAANFTSCLQQARELSYLEIRGRFVAFETLLPSLRQLPHEHTKNLLKQISALMNLNYSKSPLDIAIFIVMAVCLDRGKPSYLNSTSSADDLTMEAWSIFRIISSSIDGDYDEIASALAFANEKFPKLGGAVRQPFENDQDLSIGKLRSTLQELRNSSPTCKVQLMEVVAAIGRADHKSPDHSWMLLRALGHALDLPYPLA